jgi:hypothetical protein
MTFKDLLTDAIQSQQKQVKRKELAKLLLGFLRLKTFTKVDKRLATYLVAQLKAKDIIISISKPYTWSIEPEFTAYYRNDYTNQIKLYSVKSYDYIIEQLEKFETHSYGEYEQAIKFLENKEKVKQAKTLASQLVKLAKEAGEYTDTKIIKVCLDELSVYL